MTESEEHNVWAGVWVDDKEWGLAARPDLLGLRVQHAVLFAEDGMDFEDDLPGL